MRQEKTLKIVANHRIHPATVLKENVGSDKSWVFNTFDFADGELTENTFAIRFKTPELANEFKEAYEAAAVSNGALSAGGEAKSEAVGDDVPVVSDIQDIYGDGPLLQSMCERYAECAQKFIATFDANPEFFVRAPGRVNLIGEHIDYMGYSVLPMAIANDVLIAGRAVPDSSQVQLANVSDRFGAKDLPKDPSQPVAAEEHHWTRYFHCGYKGVFDAAGEAAPQPSGLQAMVSGRVPPGAGVSSSSALVVASFTATALGNGLSFGRVATAEACRQCEQYVGTMGGGMDQAISCLGVAGEAKHIRFNPLSASPVRIPVGGTFVIANSLTPSEKAKTANVYFNKRVVECKIAAFVLGKALGLEAWDSLTTLREVQEGAGETTEGMLKKVAELLKPEPYSAAELEEELGRGLRELFSANDRALAVLAEAADYKLRDRASHVYSEAARVLAFESICEEGGEPEQALARLGELMTASQDSCRDQYQCSCDELDALVAACLTAGALGSRLTGAGWGGCTVSLVRDEDLDAFLASVTDSYYKDNQAVTGDVSEVLFPSKACSGLAIYKPE